jgi:hypothetical protein
VLRDIDAVFEHTEHDEGTVAEHSKFDFQVGWETWINTFEAVMVLASLHFAP